MYWLGVLVRNWRHIETNLIRVFWKPFCSFACYYYFGTVIIIAFWNGKPLAKQHIPFRQWWSSLEPFIKPLHSLLYGRELIVESWMLYDLDMYFVLICVILCVGILPVRVTILSFAFEHVFSLTLHLKHSFISSSSH